MPIFKLSQKLLETVKAGRSKLRDIQNFSNILPEKHEDRIQVMNQILKSLSLPAPGDVKYQEFPHFAPKTPENLENPNFTLVSWNVQKAGPEHHKLEQIIEHLRAEYPDILVLQELTQFTKTRSQIERIAQNLGYRYTSFAPEFVELKKGAQGVIGQATFSRFPILNTQSIELKKVYDWADLNNRWARLEPRLGHRNANQSIIQVGNKIITLFNTHQEIFGDLHKRLDQFQQLKKIALDHENPIIAGDLNTVDIEGVMKIVSPIAGADGGLETLPINVVEIITNYVMEKANNYISQAWTTDPSPSVAKLWNNLYFTEFLNAHSINEPSQRLARGLAGSFRLDYILPNKENFRVLNSKFGPWDLSDHRALFSELQLIT